MPTNTKKRDKVLLLISSFKLLKGALLLAVALGLLNLIGKDLAAELYRWTERLNVDTGSPFLDKLVSTLDSLSHSTLSWFSAGAFLYSGLFLTEGIGLLLQKRWAEYFTVIITASFIPFEIYALAVYGFSFLKTALLVVNVAILLYLIWRLKRCHEHPLTPQSTSAPGFQPSP